MDRQLERERDVEPDALDEELAGRPMSDQQAQAEVDGPTPREAIAAYHSANGKRIASMMVYLRQAEIIQRGIEGICNWNGIEYDSEDVGRKARGMLDAVLDAALAGVVEAEPDGSER